MIRYARKINENPKQTRIRFLALLISLFITMLMGTWVEYAANYLLPDIDFEISYGNPDNPAGVSCIVDTAQEADLYERVKNSIDGDGWTVVEATEHNNEYIVLDGAKKTTIRFSMPAKLESFIACTYDNNSGEYTIQTSGGESVVMFPQSEGDNASVTRIYPARKEYLQIFVLAALYFCFFLMVAAVVLWLVPMLVKRCIGCSILFTETKISHFLISYIALYLCAIYQYKAVGVPNLLKFGDQCYYWNIDIFQAGQMDSQRLSEMLVPHRGYLCNVVPSFCKYISERAGWDALYIYYLFTSFSIAWLFFVVLPNIYKLMTERKPLLLNSLLSLFVFLGFWNGMLTAVLVDLFAVTAFFSGMWMLLSYHKEKRWRYAVFLGFFIAVSSDIRVAYKYGWVVILLAFLAKKLVDRQIVISRKNIAAIAVAILCFVVTLIPQYKINKAWGHFGFLPFNIQEPNEQTVLESGMNWSLGTAYSTYPMPVDDSQQKSMKAMLYNSEDTLSVPQVIRVYLHTPVESLTYLAKKIFVAFDVKTNVSYPETIPWRESSGLLFSFANYFVLLSSIYILINGKKVRANEKTMTCVIFVSLVLFDMIVHVEWRYFVAMYIMLYYIFSYHLLPASDEEKENYTDYDIQGYLRLILVGEVICFLLSLSICA